MISYVTYCRRGSLKNLKDKVHVNTTRVNLGLGSEEMNEAKVLGRKQQKKKHQKNKNNNKKITKKSWTMEKEKAGARESEQGQTLKKDSFHLAFSALWRYNLRGNCT